MRFLVDAQLPRRFSTWLRSAGHDAIHASSLPAGNATRDADLALAGDAENRIVVTKDSDFVVSHLLRGTPIRLLLISTGNIGNRELEGLLRLSLASLAEAFESHRFIELDRMGYHVRD